MGLHIHREVFCVLRCCIFYIWMRAGRALGYLHHCVCADWLRYTHKMAFSAWLWALWCCWKWFSATGIPHCGHVSDANQPFVRIIITSAGRSRSSSLSAAGSFSPLRQREAHFCAGMDRNYFDLLSHTIVAHQHFWDCSTKLIRLPHTTI